MGLDGDFIEEVADSVHIFADDIISHSWHQPSMRQPNEVLAFRNLRNLLVKTLGIEVEHAGIGGVELLIRNLPYLLAAIALVSENAGGLNVAPLCLSIIPMIEQVFVLVNTHFHVISGLPALSGLSAGVVDHDSLQVEGHLS